MDLVLGSVSQDLTVKLIEEYLEIKKRYVMSDWGPGELKGGRFAEVVLRIFQHLLGVPITPPGTDIPAQEKTKLFNLVTSHATIDEHVRQKVTVLTKLLLDFRNNRDAGHLGGFSANSMDAMFVMTSATWILCELIRVYGNYSMPEAQKIVDELAVKEYPVVMEFEGDIFLTRPDLKAKQEVLVLLSKAKAGYDLLFSKTRDSNNTRFQRTLQKMVSDKMIGEKNGEYFIMPAGMAEVTKEKLLSYVP